MLKFYFMNYETLLIVFNFQLLCDLSFYRCSKLNLKYLKFEKKKNKNNSKIMF